MTDEERKQTALEMLRQCDASNVSRVAEMITEDFQFENVRGQSPGNYKSPLQQPFDREAFLGFLPSVPDMLQGGMNVTYGASLAEGDHVAVFGSSDAITAKGKVYRNRYCWHFTFSGDKVSRFHEYCDTHLTDTVFFDQG